MSDLAWTRLVDLLDIGYIIEAERSTDEFLYLQHMDNRAPTIGLWRSGDIEPLGNPIWPDHFRYEHSIGAPQGARFQQFCSLHEYPNRSQQRRHHVRKLLVSFALVCWTARALAAVHWHLIGKRE